MSNISRVILVMIFLIISTNFASAFGLVSTQGNVTMKVGSVYNITLNPIFNFTSMNSDGTTLSMGINSSVLKLNSTSDLNLTLVNSSNDNINFTVQSTTGIMNISSTMIAFKPYNLSVDTVPTQTQIANASGVAFFNYNSWSTHNFNIKGLNELTLYSPFNNSVGNPTTVMLKWTEGVANTPYTYQLSTDSQFINIISSGSEASTNGILYSSGNIVLNQNTQYWWKVKNVTGSYTSAWTFTVGAGVITPGRFNISVWDEQNHSLQIMDYTVSLYNNSDSGATYYQTKSTTSGWTNFSSIEVINDEYLIIINPIGNYSSYMQRMVISTSPINITIYVPNSNTNTIYIVSFSILDITGLFPYTTSVISVYNGGFLMDKSYFSADGAHPVYLINGSNYQIQITNAESGGLFNFNNYIPIASGISQITINNFAVNNSDSNLFKFNITNTKNDVTLNWQDTYNHLNNFNFTVYKGTSLISVCNLQTSVRFGQSICSITGYDKFYVVFSANLTDGNYQNKSYWFDTSVGQLPTSEGINPIDGSPMGIGYTFNYGTFIMPRWVYTLVSVILIIVLLGSWGAYFSHFGSIITSVFALLLATKGWFAPLGIGDIQQEVVISLLTAMTILSIIAYIAKYNKGNEMMAYKVTMLLIFINFGIAISDLIISNVIFPQTTIGTTFYQNNLVGLRADSMLNGSIIIDILGMKMSLTTIIFTAGVLALFAFSLLPLFIPIMNAFFILSLSFSEYYIGVLPMSWGFKLPLMVGIGIIYMIGISQFASRQAAHGV